MESLYYQPYSTSLTLDALGSRGCRTVKPGRSHFNLLWPPLWSSVNIACKEMIPIVIAATIWGHNWKGSHFLFHCNNMAVVSLIIDRSAKKPCLAHLAKCSFFLAASHQFTFSAEHILRVCNGAADALSHNRLDLFHSHFSQVSPPPISIPSPLLNLLLETPYSGHLHTGGSCLPILWCGYIHKRKGDF